MSRAVPNPGVPAGGSIRQQLLPETQESSGANGHGANPLPHLVNVDYWGTDNPLDPRQQSWNSLGPSTGQDSQSGASAKSSPSFELDQLKVENVELRSIIAELQQQLHEVKKQDDQSVLDRQKEYESLLEEKSELIRNLHLKIRELEEQKPVAPPIPKEEELLALSEELERERCQLQQQARELERERKQMVDDEEIMTQQMREMEVQMARERADFARQRSELNRLSEEIRREVENVERNGLLNQRLGQLRQRFQDATNPQAGSAPGQASPPGNSTAPSDGNHATPKRKETFLGRIFG
jgi:hypothetical protein